MGQLGRGLLRHPVVGLGLNAGSPSAASEGKADGRMPAAVGSAPGADGLKSTVRGRFRRARSGLPEAITDETSVETLLGLTQVSGGFPEGSSGVEVLAEAGCWAKPDSIRSAVGKSEHHDRVAK